jgi:uncharacterized protein
MSFDKVVYLNKLFDHYSSLLTQRQQEVFISYYHEDLSYQEIADELGISRAGVFDTLKRTVSFLENTEMKLGFVKKYDTLISELSALNIKEVNDVIDRLDIGGSNE